MPTNIIEAYFTNGSQTFIKSVFIKNHFNYYLYLIFEILEQSGNTLNMYSGGRN